MSEQPNQQLNHHRSSAAAASMPAPSITLHIEELALHGIDSAVARYELGIVIEQELTRLLAEHGLPSGLDHDLAVGRVNGGSFEFKPDARPDTIGAHIAAAVYRGLHR